MGKINKEKEVVVIGSGFVGTSFIHNCVSRNIARHYGIIDIDKEKAYGNVMDFEDAIATNEYQIDFKEYNYSNLKDVDLIVITAGFNQKVGQTRLDLLEKNVSIIADIAKQVKKSGFSGISIMATNPVDIMTQIYQEVTGFDSSKVIDSGTSLDSARLQYYIAEKCKVSLRDVSAYVVGEHGDSSVSVLSSATISGVKWNSWSEEHKKYITDTDAVSTLVRQRAGEIYKRKKLTNFGIGSSLAELAFDILNDQKRIHSVGVKLKGQYGFKGYYFGTPALIGAGGIEKILEVDLDNHETELVKKSFEVVVKSVESARKFIK